MADPKRQLIRLIEHAQTDDIAREGHTHTQRERERESCREKLDTWSYKTLPSAGEPDALKEFHNLPGSDFLPPGVKRWTPCLKTFIPLKNSL
jgi:hypothetical protein